MPYEEGLVSVIIPTYRRSDTVARAIDSVLGQTYRKIECIVVNDNTPNDACSTALYQSLGKYEGDRRFRFIEQETHVNGAEARNCGIRAAKGEYVAFLDDDDWWKEGKIEAQVRLIRARGESCGGVSTLVEFYRQGKPFRWSRPYKDGRIFKQILRREVDVTTCSVLLRHTALDDAGYFDNSLMRHQEIQMLAFFASKYDIVLLKEHLTCISVDLNDNAPASDNARKIKRAFFHAVEPLMDRLSKAEQKRIRALHAQELCLIEWRERKILPAIKDGLKALRDPITFFLAMKRILGRRIEYIPGSTERNKRRANDCE